MDTLRRLQNEFLDYLLDDSSAGIVRRIESTPRRSAAQRMALYGNAYILRLKEALSTDYERLHSYLGDELFDNLMQAYIERYPSQHTSLRYFGRHMVALIEQLAPYNQVPEVAEIARIEQAFANSFDAADCACVTLEQLAGLEPAAWAGLSIRFQDAVQLLPLHYNSFPIWRALSNEEIPPKQAAAQSNWLIWRQDLVSRYRALEDAEAAALNVALASGSFAEVCTALLDYFTEADTPLQAVGYLQQWVHDEMVCGLD